MISTRQAQALRLQCTKTLGMSEEDYKALLAEWGVTSSKQLRPAQFSAIMQQLRPNNVAGWTPPPDKQLGLIFYLWGQLYAAGKVQQASAALSWMRKYLQQEDGVIEFTPRQKSRCIERLKKWLERE